MKKSGVIFGDILESVIIAVILAVIIRFFIFQPFYIPSGSMEPTLTEGDRIIVNKFLYRFKEPQRADVIVFKYPLDEKRDFIKRIIGVPGDTVEIKNNELIINGKPVPEPYLAQNLEQNGNYGPVTVPQDRYLMLGDNRNNSEDSRIWGMLPKENIRGKAVVLYWPINRIGFIGDLSTYTASK
ncbi:MAG: signal peptidase I [Clostridia bacterium]|nr:signal peptidase I [Clostridia bacterium]